MPKDPAQESPLENIFVYGSLRSGEANHRVMASVKALFVSKAEIRGERRPTRYGFPCLLEGSGLVDGEIYAVDAEGVERLDHFEGHPEFYERRKTETVQGVPVWAYYGTGVQAALPQAQTPPVTRCR